MPKLQNQAIIQALWNFLKLQGPEGPPQQVNNDDLKIVVNIPLNVIPEGFKTKLFIVDSLAIGGTNENTIPCLSQGEDGSADVTRKNYRIVAINAFILYTAAGAIAAAGNKIGIFLPLFDKTTGDGYLGVYNYDNGKTVSANITNYRFAIGCNVSGDISLVAPMPLNLFIGPDVPIIPGPPSKGQTIGLAPFSINAAGVLTNFPAGTLLFIRVFYDECDQPFIPPL